MITIALSRADVKEQTWQVLDAACIEVEIESVLDLLNEHLIDVRDAAARLDGLYATLHQVADGAPRWGEYIPCDAPPLADDGRPVCEWTGMYSEVTGW